MALADAPLFMAAVVKGPITQVIAKAAPLTADISVVEAVGKRSLKAMRRMPETRSKDPMQRWTRMQPATAPHPQPPSRGAGGEEDLVFMDLKKMS